jgi:hypothetical protein
MTKRKRLSGKKTRRDYKRSDFPNGFARSKYLSRTPAVTRLDAATAIVSPDKVRDYLLSSSHPIGRFKSTFFRSLGYEQHRWQVLEHDLRATLSTEIQPAGSNKYGEKYAASGSLIGPNGRTAAVVSIWIILNGEAAARFVTAYPED